MDFILYIIVCVLLQFGKTFEIDEEKIIKGIAEFKLTARRMELVKIKEDILVINDTYNASFDSVKAALEVLGQTTAKRRIAVLGNMLELGDYAKELHQKLGEEIIKNKIDMLITVGELAKHINEKAEELGMKESYNFGNIDEASETLKKQMQKDDVVLLKASNSMHFDKILEKIK